MNAISFFKRALQGSTGGAVPVADDQPLPVTLNGAMGVTPSLGGLAVLGNGRLSGTVTIANGASLSGAIDLGSSSLAGILMPAAWTAAGLSFTVSTSLAGTYVPLWNAIGSEYTVPSASAVASQFIVLPVADFLGIQFIKVRSGTAAAAVNQGGDRALVLVTVA
jgi:hypothetical protein